VSSIGSKSRVYHAITAFLLLVLALAIVGCMSTRGIQVIPVPLGSRGVLDLSADDVVEIMRAAGFSDTQIVEHGKQVHDALAESGAVQIKIGRKVEAIFAVNGNDIYISTRLRGYFIYNINTGWVTGERG
jgi:hypothetical protein